MIRSNPKLVVKPEPKILYIHTRYVRPRMRKREELENGTME
jgi:hypothetical protein